MGASVSSLAVYMNGEPVGLWTRGSGGVQRFEYLQSWIESPAARPISLSMPLDSGSRTYSGTIVESFFSNLLPDNDKILTRIQRRFSCRSTGAFDLLREVGRDCAGALQILPDDEIPGNIKEIRAEPLDEGAIEQLLQAAASGDAGWFNDDAFRISIAGVQEKTALLFHEGRWCRPLGTTPTTHILKLPLGRIGPVGIDMSRSVENEWLCLSLLSALGLPVAHSKILRFGSFKALAVERFDRRLVHDGSWWVRLPQEDICQAMGVPPERKYESEGGPGIEAILRLLLASTTASADRRQFFRSLIAFWLLAAPDGHAKNFSIFLEMGGRFRLSPLYDVMSAYPVMGHGPGQLAAEKLKLAMAVSGKTRHYHWAAIQRRHWIITAGRCGLGDVVEEILDELTKNVPKAVDTVGSSLPPDFPADIADAICTGMVAAARRLAGC